MIEESRILTGEDVDPVGPGGDYGDLPAIGGKRRHAGGGAVRQGLFGNAAEGRPGPVYPNEAVPGGGGQPTVGGESEAGDALPVIPVPGQGGPVRGGVNAHPLSTTEAHRQKTPIGGKSELF